MATFLASVTFYLCKTPSALIRLTEEIRTSFASFDEITATRALQLSYLQAVIAEGLRIFPPGSQGFPRTCPGANIDGIWIPQGVSRNSIKDQCDRY